MLDNPVGRHIYQDVWNIKDKQCHVELVSLQSKPAREASNRGISDIGSIQRPEEPINPVRLREYRRENILL
jgi:hypothetical protein